MTRYRTIVADPPWDYGKDNERSVSFTNDGKGPRIERSMGYATMSVEEIKALSVQSMAHKDCRLWLWTTNRHLGEAFGVMEAWGFVYKQTIVWRKTGNPSPFGGSVAPNHAEYLLVGSRGTPELGQRLASSVIDAPAVVFGHSAKPECFLDLIELVSPEPRVELFARSARMFGWDYWGDESLGTAEMPETVA